MTFQPPPSPPGGTPPPPPPPPPGQWGPPPGGGAPGSSGSFDPKSVNPLDWGILGIGVLVFLFSFIDFYDGAEISSGSRSADISSGSASAWNDVAGGGFFSWFAMIFAIAGAAIVAIALFRPQQRMRFPARLVGLVLFAAAALFEIIGIFVTPGDSGSALGSSVDVSLNHGFGFWASLILILAGLVVSLMRFQQTGGQLPGGMSSKVPNIGGYGPQGGLAGGTGQGYGPPAPGQYGGQQQPPPGQYGAPQQPPPPPGYSPPPPPPGYNPPSQ